MTVSGISVTSETTVCSGVRSTDVDDLTSTSLETVVLSGVRSTDVDDVSSTSVEFFRRDTKQQTWGPL